MILDIEICSHCKHCFALEGRVEGRCFPTMYLEVVPLLYDLDLFNQCAEDCRVLLSSEKWDDIHPNMHNIPVEWEWTQPLSLIFQKNARKEVLEFIEVFKEAIDMEKADTQMLKFL